ncbi:hypothetical protein BOX15_Mlig028527g1 [Macrostomum lignano]|uniref:inositol-polyphosphate 5-phosphatase n=1 Tax=Macrostomum lignano TaxID=282301 RepID=A0A267GRA2_9PLAT|nr:hypothetical protein BOX15_Mlig028527g1 [Macrostomum lignano]
MDRDNLKTLLITANVGSLFDHKHLLQPWLKNLFQAISDKDPDFIAVHCQEIGGKNFTKSMPNVDSWISELMTSEALKLYDKARIFLDKDYEAQDTFTALGSLYFVHARVPDVALWDFNKSRFVQLRDRFEHRGPIEAVGEVEKRKFPLKFFPNQVLSRKGYMRTRWRAGVATFDLVNVHLFHDASNLDGLSQTPSVYARHRRDALMWILDQLRSGPPVKDEFAIAASSGSVVKGVEDGGESLSAERLPVPTFVFGDFNFRLNLEAYVKTVTQKCRRTEQRDEDGHLSIEYYRGDDRVLTVGKKQFHSCTHSREFFENKHNWLGQLDFEPSSFDSSLFEFPVTFPPTYPFSEGASERDATEYMATRLPAWCDRVLCSSSARSAILCPPEDPTQYGVLGLQDCMGDHKPVYLYTLLCYGASAADSHCLMENADFPPPALLSRLLEQPGVQVKMSERNGAIYTHVRRDGATICIFKETAV